MAYYLQLLWLFLPAFVANAAPVILARLPVIAKWDRPIHRRLFGDHKTWRGFLLSPLFAVAFAVLQYFLRNTPPIAHVYPPDWSLPDAVLLGLLLGFGAMIGDAAKSFFKRRIGIAPGGAWPFFDGIDYIVGALFAAAPWFIPTFPGIIFLLLMGPFLSLVANSLSYAIGWKKVWY